jgi:hypothetical protein
MWFFSAGLYVGGYRKSVWAFIGKLRSDEGQEQQQTRPSPQTSDGADGKEYEVEATFRFSLSHTQRGISPPLV